MMLTPSQFSHVTFSNTLKYEDNIIAAKADIEEKQNYMVSLQPLSTKRKPTSVKLQHHQKLKRLAENEDRFWKALSIVHLIYIYQDFYLVFQMSSYGPSK